jgi:nitrogen fixation NifU-like protein
MADLRELYQDVMLDHHRKPRNFHKLDHSNRQADGYNPLCGDKISVYMRIENGVIADIGFVGVGCAIATASASMMTECLKGKTEADARALFENFQQLLANRAEAQPEPSILGQLAAFSGVREYPVRVKCATLAWHTMKAALEQSDEIAKTE